MESPDEPTKAERLSSNPRFFPMEVVPKVIFRTRNGQYQFLMKDPNLDKGYLWYMTEVQMVTVEQLTEEMKVPGRRWFATNRTGYDLQRETGASTTVGEPYVCLGSIRDPRYYYFGRRHAKPPADRRTLVVTVAELFLKSTLHQNRYIRLLLDNMRRVLHNPHIIRSGTTTIEIRKLDPTEEQIKLLALVPGIAKIYRAREGSGGEPRGAFLMDGAGGVPILPEQRGLCLLSGGIDSPVAAYRMMTRGCHINGVHFLNSTNDTAAVVEKNRRICEQLSLIQGRFDMHYVDISKLQSQIVANVPNHNRTLIYKWCMLALASSFDDSDMIITGDSAGQVASQTVHNISTLYPSVKKAVISPLVGMSKNYIMEEARRIHTYGFSIQEGADCCQYMMCKTGANLCMGRKTLVACARNIKVANLPVLKEVYRDGKLCKSSEFTFLPDLGVREAGIEVRKMKTGLFPVGEGQNGTAVDGEADNTAAGNDGHDDGEDEPAVYFDAAAGTLMPVAVKRAMFRAPEGNPNSMHESGCAARMAVERVRAALAKAMCVPANEIIFTSGGTESNNIALHGYRVERDEWSHASTAANGEDAPHVCPDATVVRVVDLVNHETGSVALSLKRPAGGRLHLDASQALLKIDFSTLDLSEVDSITVTAHKINGPVGVGAVYLRGLECNRMYIGGAQEKGIRPGTENVPAIVGLGVALALDRSQSVHGEIETFIVEELEAMGCEVNRRGETSGYIVHATLPESFDNTQVVSKLSSKYKVEIGTGSACKTGVMNTTVYDTLGKKPAPTRSIRISWDSFNTMKEAQRVIAALHDIIV